MHMVPSSAMKASPQGRAFKLVPAQGFLSSLFEVHFFYNRDSHTCLGNQGQQEQAVCFGSHLDSPAMTKVLTSLIF